MNREILQVLCLEVVYSCAALCSLGLNFDSISLGMLSSTKVPPFGESFF